MSITPESAPNTRTASPTLVAYLFADRFGVSEDTRKPGQRVFGTGAVVVESELGAALVAIGLWQLRETGAVRLEEFHKEKKLRFLSTSGVRVIVTGRVQERLVEAAEAGGVEKRLLETLARLTNGRLGKRAREEGVGPYSVAYWVCHDSRDPCGAMISIAIDDALALGYLDRVPAQGPRWNWRTGKSAPTLQPNAERIATLKPAADELAERWQEFREGGEASMADRLRREIYDGLRPRAEAADQPDSDY